MILDDEDLNAAVANGLLTSEQAAALRDLAAARRSASAADEEDFRLVNSFNDIFVSIAVVLTLLAVAILTYQVSMFLPGPCVAALAWGMGEHFTRKRRMALPSIVLLLAFSGGLGALGLALGQRVASSMAWVEVGPILTMLLGLALACAGALAHWRRFHVPITVAVLSLSALGVVLALVLLAIPDLRVWASQTTLICGLLLFAFALRWDASDVARKTRRSDVAFWLHLAAAPLIVHPVFAMVGLLGNAVVSADKALLAIVIYVALGVMALVTDRRAVLLSALAYVLFATASLLKLSGSVTTAFAVTGLVIGSALLLMSVWWRPLRAPLVRALPARIRTMVPEAS